MWGKIRQFFEKLAFTRSEIRLVQLLALLTLIGAWIPTVRRWFEEGAPDVTALKQAEFAELAAEADSTVVTDTSRLSDAMWRRRVDQIESLTVAGRADSVSALLERYEDAPVFQVGVNSAGVEELASLPRIGPKLAERILDYRRQHGAFQSVEELTRVKGIGKKMLETIRPYITIY